MLVCLLASGPIAPVEPFQVNRLAKADVHPGRELRQHEGRHNLIRQSPTCAFIGQPAALHTPTHHTQLFNMSIEHMIDFFTVNVCLYWYGIRYCTNNKNKLRTETKRCTCMNLPELALQLRAKFCKLECNCTHLQKIKKKNNNKIPQVTQIKTG